MSRSLRTTLIGGLLALNVVVIAAAAGVVYWHAEETSETALRHDLRLRAHTLSGLMEMTPGKPGFEFELPLRALPEYKDAESGMYAVFFDAYGDRVVRSPSAKDLIPQPIGEWTLGGHVFADQAIGPDGLECATVTYSFRVAADAEDFDGDDDDDDPAVADWTPPATGSAAAPRPALPLSQLRQWRIVVAQDRSKSRAELAALAWFLVWVGAGSLVVTAAGGLLVARLVLRPVRRMTQDALMLSPEDATRRLVPDTIVSELRSLATSFNDALDRIAGAFERQRRFAADASHELRTPVAVLRGNAELLLMRDRDAQEYKDGLKTQARVATRMQAVIDNLLYLARADSADPDEQREEFELAPVVSGICDEFDTLSVQCRVELRRNLGEGVRVRGDRVALGRVVQNLLSNAFKFTPEHGVVRIRVEESGGRAAIEVSDTGPGIPVEHRDQVFERFYRVGEGSDRREGAGLGLAIVSAAVRAHEGEVRVTTSTEGGTTFLVLLPLAAGEPAALRGRRLAQAEG